MTTWTVNFYPYNILELGTVTVTGTPDTGYPESRLYDRAISLYWKDTVAEAKDFTVLQRSTEDSYTKLLLHMDGADESTTFLDDGFTGHTVTANGDAQIDTAQKKYGTGSGLFDGTGDYLSIPDHADWNLGSNEFTIEFWARFNSLGNTQHFYSQYVDEDNQIYFVGLVLGNEIANLVFLVKSGGATEAMLNVSLSTELVVDTWYHIALIRGWNGNVNDYAITVDGQSVGTTTDSSALSDMAANLHIGYIGIDSYYLNGWLDGYRVSVGIARWTANFTPPIEIGQSLEVDFLAISKHNFNGIAMQWQYSTDDFSADINDAVTDWTQEDNLQIIKTMGSGQTKMYWRVTLASMVNPQCSEIFMSKEYSFNAITDPNSFGRDMANVQWNRTVGGLERSTKFGVKRKVYKYNFYLSASEWTDFETVISYLNDYAKPFYFKDHLDNYFMARFDTEPIFDFSHNTYTRVTVSIIEQL